MTVAIIEKYSKPLKLLPVIYFTVVILRHKLTIYGNYWQISSNHPPFCCDNDLSGHVTATHMRNPICLHFGKCPTAWLARLGMHFYLQSNYVVYLYAHITWTDDIMLRPPRRYLAKLSGLAVRLGFGEIQRCQVNEGRQLCCNCRGGNFSDYHTLSNKRAHKMVPSEAAL